MITEKNFFRQELVDFYDGAETKEAFFKQIYEKLFSLGFVNESYLTAIMEREASYPTGLRTASCDVAIPHTDPAHIRKPFIYIVNMQTSVVFGEMGTEDAFVQPKYIFCLGFDKGEDQLVILQELMAMFMNEKVMASLLTTGISKQIILERVTTFLKKECKK